MPQKDFFQLSADEKKTYCF